jgi:hypothetical protein
MSSATKTLRLMALYSIASAALAQQPPPSAAPPAAKPTPQSEAGEPRADTSATPAPNPPAAPAAAENPSPAPKPAPAAARTPAARTAAGAPAASKSPPKSDRLELGTATVTGDREQPKVMYIVPWKRSDIGDLAGKPMNSLVDEILAPVDRDVFKREVVYYRAVQAEASQNGAPPKPAPQGEK